MRVGGALCPGAQSVSISGAGLWALLLSLWELDALSLWELLDALPEEAVLCEELLDEDAVLCELLPEAEVLWELLPAVSPEADVLCELLELLLVLPELEVLWELLDVLPEPEVLCEPDAAVPLEVPVSSVELLPEPEEAEELEELPEEPDELPDAAAATVTSSALLVTRLSL